MDSDDPKASREREPNEPRVDDGVLRTPASSADNGPFAAWDIYEATTGTRPTSTSSTYRRPPLVLIVDDDADHREYCATRFAKLGCRVLAGVDGADAVKLAHLTKPDLILMDLIMPGTDGVEATHQLRSDPVTRQVRIVGMTNYGARWQALARSAGCELVVAKSALVDDFEAIADRLIAGRNAAPEAKTAR